MELKVDKEIFKKDRLICNFLIITYLLRLQETDYRRAAKIYNSIGLFGNSISVIISSLLINLLI